MCGMRAGKRARGGHGAAHLIRNRAYRGHETNNTRQGPSEHRAMCREHMARSWSALRGQRHS